MIPLIWAHSPALVMAKYTKCDSCTQARKLGIKAYRSLHLIFLLHLGFNLYEKCTSYEEKIGKWFLHRGRYKHRGRYIWALYVRLPIILNHITVISFSINHSTLVQHHGNKIVFVLLLWWPIAMCRGRYTFFRTKNFSPKNTNWETWKFFHEKILITSLFTGYSGIWMPFVGCSECDFQVITDCYRSSSRN